MISSPNRSRRSGSPVRLVVIHTAEGARTTASLGAYFSRTSSRASSHAGVDDHGIETYVPYSEAAWTLRSGNSISDNLELCGFAAWTRGQWLNEHRPMLDHTARWIRERCQARGIPIRKLTPAQVAAGQAGVCGHHDWTVGMRDGTHTDPGANFPWDVVIALAAGTPARPSPTPRPAETTVLRHGMTHPDVRRLQTILTTRYPSYAKWSPITDYFGDKTLAAVKEFQRRVQLAPDGIVGPATRRALGM